MEFSTGNTFVYPCDLPSGQYFLRLLAEDGVRETYAYGEVLFEVEQTVIESISLEGYPAGNDIVEIDQVPVSIGIMASITNLPGNPQYDWEIEIENPSLLGAMIDPGNGNPASLVITQCESTAPGSAELIFYLKDEFCDTVYTLSRIITILAPHCDAPDLLFTPADVSHEILLDDTLFVTITPPVMIDGGIPLDESNCAGFFTLVHAGDNVQVPLTTVDFTADTDHQRIAFQHDPLIQGDWYRYGLNENGINALISIQCERKISTPYDTNFRVGFTGYHELMADNLSFYPNPSTGRVHIEKEDPAEYLLEVISPSGLIMRSIRFSDSKFDLNLTSLDPGIYLFRFVNQRSGTVNFAKLVKL
jgi:hypothetical protein